MTNKNVPEDEFIKKLSANEKKKLFRNIESFQSNMKKSTSSVSSTGLKSFNNNPKPFIGNNNGTKPLQPTKFSQHQVLSTRASGALSKPSQPTNGKSINNNEFVIPKLNPDLVSKFNAQDASSTKYKLKDSVGVSKRPSFLENNKVSPNTKNPPKAGSSFGSSSSNYSKVTPSPRPGSVHNPVKSTAAGVLPALKQAMEEKKTPDNKGSNSFSVISNDQLSQSNQIGSRTSSSNYNNVKPTQLSNQKKPSMSNLKVLPKESSSKPPSLPKQSSINSGNIKKQSESQQASNVANKSPSVIKQQRVQPITDKNSTRNLSPKPQPASAVANSHLLPQRVEPLNKKNVTKVNPPTAIVAPIQDKSKQKISEVKSSAEAARMRSVSTPVPPSQPSNAVSYSPATDKINLPNLSMAENSVIANDVTKKRSISEVSKVSAQILKPPINKSKKKLGHDFQPHELKDWVNWCDACGSVILSLFGKCVACTKCKMVCHVKCAMSVSLTCEADQQTRSLTISDSALNFYKTIVQETKDELSLQEFNTIQRDISIEEVQQKIEEFNQTVRGSQQMTLQDDGKTFRGFIRVTMNLTRPVSVVDSSSKTARKPTNHQRKSSFYIDKGAVKALHLTSDTTSEQVVQALLLKYNITDNPMKFALFEKEVREEGHVILRKMLPRERPLLLRLLWGNGNSNKRGFTLQENESRDIHWESFSIAELQMFIKILDKEENDYISEIKIKYKNKGRDIKDAMEHRAKMSLN